MPAAEPTPLRRSRSDQARQVADVLRHQIHAGVYDGGLPPEQELAAEFFVSRNAIREALTALKAEGRIDRGPKIGTHVAQRKYESSSHRLSAARRLVPNDPGYGRTPPGSRRRRGSPSAGIGVPVGGRPDAIPVGSRQRGAPHGGRDARRTSARRLRIRVARRARRQ